MFDVKQLRADIEAKLDKWDERNTFTLRGAGNLTRSDIDTLLMCCAWYEKYGSLNGLAYFGREIRRVLEKYGYKFEVKGR